MYYKTAKKAMVALFSRRSPVTGLVGNGINVNTGKWEGTESSISGGIDSYYEYLLKAWKLFGDRDCKRMWDSSLAAVNRYLADTSGGTLWYGHADMQNGKRTAPDYGALDAFFAGALFLSAFLLFVLEPMVAKSILPTLGGTPMAWNTRLRGTEVVDLVEAEAARDDRFTWALGRIWIVAKGLPPDLVERIVIAGGNAIQPA